MKLKTRLRGVTYEFRDLVDVLAKAGEEKAGDVLAGIAATSSAERVAAKRVLAEVSLGEIRANPAIPPEIDEVSRVQEEQINEQIFGEIKHWTVGYFREWILSHETTGDMIRRVSRALTGEMASAVAKLMSNMDLVYAASKIHVVTHCETTLGLPGTLSYRIQANHPSDSIEGITASVLEGLSYTSGDACIGINPNDDSVENTIRIMNAIQEIKHRYRVPTQTVVLSHITTQMKAIEQGAVADMFFQSIAGTQKCNEEFGISAALLDEALDMIRKRGGSPGPNLMYFETGQGSELSLGAHHGVDMQTLEARTYAFGRRYSPFMVNNVTGFIGPETHFDGKQIIRGSLEDHFMGKLLGLPMGMAPCYTNHVRADQNDQENAIMLLALAGATYYMGVPQNDDCMLAYQDTSYHDDVTLRELLNRRPTPEFERWCREMGLLDENGRLTARAGDPTIFLCMGR